MPIDIDFDFISAREGGRQLDGYVPAANVSRSGVTIATGFDLGQCNALDLRRLGLPGALIEQLSPYLGLQGLEARRYLEEHPLRIERSEAMTIDEAVKAAHVREVAHAYNTSELNVAQVPFSELPPQAQTVIASVSFQYGVNLRARTPRFWRAVTAQDWARAIAELRDFGDAYPSRRGLEANLLEQVLQ